MGRRGTVHGGRFAPGEGLVALVDRLVPAYVHEGDPTERRRARLVVFNTSVFIAYGIFQGEMEMAVGLGTARCSRARSWWSAPVVGLGSISYLRRRGDGAASAMSALVGLFAVITILTFMKGGIDAPGLSWFVVLPVVARALCGSRTAVVVAGLSMLVVLSFALFQTYGVPVPPPTGTALEIKRVVAICAGSILCAGLVYMNGVFEEEAQLALAGDARLGDAGEPCVEPVRSANVSHADRWHRRGRGDARGLHRTCSARSRRASPRSRPVAVSTDAAAPDERERGWRRGPRGGRLDRVRGSPGARGAAPRRSDRAARARVIVFNTAVLVRTGACARRSGSRSSRSRRRGAAWGRLRSLRRWRRPSRVWLWRRGDTERAAKAGIGSSGPSPSPSRSRRAACARRVCLVRGVPGARARVRRQPRGHQRTPPSCSRSSAPACCSRFWAFRCRRARPARSSPSSAWSRCRGGRAVRGARVHARRLRGGRAAARWSPRATPQPPPAARRACSSPT